MTFALIGGTMIDGTGADPKPENTLVVEGTKIVEITSQSEWGGDIQIIDVSGKTLLPGIVDTHMHFGSWFQWMITQQHSYLSYLMCKTALNLRRALESGVTTVRDLGGLEWGFVDAQAHGLIPGPRLQTGGVIIQPTNGLTDIMPGVGGSITPQGQTVFLPGLPSPWADGPWAVRAKVREVLRYGAQAVKIVSGGIPWDKLHLDADRPLFTAEELQAAVDEAHRAGARVCCHTVTMKNAEAALMAIQAGTDLIDHGGYLDDRCIKEMAHRQTWFCPMFAIMDFHRSRNPNKTVNPIAAECFELTADSFRRALEAGVPIAMGTDGGLETGWQAHEMAWMVENGMTPLKSLAASTLHAAEALGLAEIIGSLEVGKEADLVVVEGNPMDDFRTLGDTRNLALVMQAGKAVSGPMAQQFPYEPPEHMTFFPPRPEKRPW